MTFAHTPYAGGAAPFTIGLAPIGADDWIEADGRLTEQLALKEAILASQGAEAFAELPESAEGQAEALALLAAHLPQRFPGTYRRDGGALVIVPAGRRVALSEGPALLAASRLVQEDLLLLRRAEAGWRLVAGSLCFPSSWLLSHKIGRDLAAIHAPVPGFAGRMESVVARIFDKLAPDALVERFNWSIYGDGRLRHAEALQEPEKRLPTPAGVAERAHIRVERQTLRRLPASGDILFTVRIHVDPLKALAGRADGRELARRLAKQLAALGPEQLAYKGLTRTRDDVLAALDALG